MTRGANDDRMLERLGVVGLDVGDGEFTDDLNYQEEISALTIQNNDLREANELAHTTLASEREENTNTLTELRGRIRELETRPLPTSNEDFTDEEKELVTLLCGEFQRLLDQQMDRRDFDNTIFNRLCGMYGRPEPRVPDQWMTAERERTNMEDRMREAARPRRREASWSVDAWEDTPDVGWGDADEEDAWDTSNDVDAWEDDVVDDEEEFERLVDEYGGDDHEEAVAEQAVMPQRDENEEREEMIAVQAVMPQRDEDEEPEEMIAVLA